MIVDDCKTNSAKVMLHAIRRCRKVYWYAYALQNYLEITKYSIREPLQHKDHLKDRLFQLSWDDDVLFIKEISDE